MALVVKELNELLLVKLIGADSPWLTLLLTWQSPNFTFDTSPGPDIEVPAIIFYHCDLAFPSLHDDCE